MILEGAALFSCAYVVNRLWNREKRDLKKLWKEIMVENSMVNEKGFTFNLVRIEAAEYGYMLIMDIPIGFSYQKLASKRDILESSLKAVVEMEHDKINGWIKFRLINKPLKDLRYKPVQTKPYELYVGYTYFKHIIINMNTLPHLLIAGINGSGKTRGMYVILCNLLYNNTDEVIELYMSQVGKTDLLLFKDYRQVRQLSRNIENSLVMYQELYNEFKRREKLFGGLTSKGILNIEDYNKKMKKPLKYIYIVSDEFSLYMPDTTDSKGEKQEKRQCLDLLKKLIKMGRAYGMFVLICLQKTTNDQMPQFIKSQVNCKMTYRQTDVYSSRNVIDDDEALKLRRREAIIIADGRYKIMTPYIDDTAIKEALKDTLCHEANTAALRTILKPLINTVEDGFIRRDNNAN